MTYTKTEAKQFSESVCKNCNKCDVRTYEHLICCPRIFNWKVLGKEDGIVRLSEC